jgi:hypothetical protein
VKVIRLDEIVIGGDIQVFNRIEVIHEFILIVYLEKSIPIKVTLF